MECRRGTAGLGQLTGAGILAAKIQPPASARRQRSALESAGVMSRSDTLTSQFDACEKLRPPTHRRQAEPPASDVKVYIELNRARALRFLKPLQRKAPRDEPIPKSTK